METTLLKKPLVDLDKSLKTIEKVMVIISKGTLESVYAGFILANGARMEGMEAEIFFTFFGLDAVIKDRLKDIHVARYRDWETDRKSTRLNSSHITRSRMPSSA